MRRAVDVLLTVYNGAATIEDSLRSLQAQTLTNISIIVVDDGSTDATPDILARIAAIDDRVLILRKLHGGIVNAANHGLAHCTAPLVARHDADDLAMPDRLARQSAYLDAHPHCIAVSCSAAFIDEAGQATGDRVRPAPPSRADATRIPSRQPSLVHPLLLARRHSIAAVGGYRHCYLAEDVDLYWRLREIGELHNTDEVLGQYRIHAGSVSGASIDNGRLQAVYSELAGLSALRRRAGRPDIAFSEDLVRELRGKPLAEMVHTCARFLDAGEQARLRPAVALKLVEFLAYRPYRMDEADWGFVRSAVAGMGGLSATCRRSAGESLVQLGIQMVAQRRWKDSHRLVLPRFLPAVIGRTALRALPRGVRDRANRLLRRG